VVVFVSFSWVTCYLSCLISRDIWRGIFAASSGRLCYGFINSGCFSSQYLLVFCFNVAHCRAISFLCTGRILLGDYLCFGLRFFFSFLVMLVDLYYFSVSAVPVGALDRVAGLLNRIWWQR